MKRFHIVAENKKYSLFQMPGTREEWLVVAEEHDTFWNFPHNLGAIDGKHTIMQAPDASGREYYN